MGEFDALAAKYGVGTPAAPAAAVAVVDPYADLAARYLKPPKAGPSEAESFGMGGVRGLTFGTAPALAKVGGRLASLLPESIQQRLIKSTTGIDAPPEAIRALGENPEAYRQIYREQEHQAEEANPKAFLAGELTGGAVAPVPGGGIAKGATTIAGKALARGAQGVIAGGMFGAGSAIGEGAPAGEILNRAGQGAAVGGVLAPVVGAVGDTALRGASALAEGAPARVNARMQRSLTEPATKRMADKLTQAFGPDGEKIIAVADRHPEMRKALATMGEDRPKPVLDLIQKTKATANASRNADIETMQAHYKNVPPSGQATISGVLDDYAALMNTADLDRFAALEKAHAEVTKLGDRLRKAQGLPPAVGGDYSGTVISPKELRELEQTIGRRAFDMGTPRTVKQKVSADLYGPLAKQMNALAENAPGVDAQKFAQTGQDIHVMIPVEEALQARVDKLAQGKKTFWERAKDSAHYVAALGSAVTAGVAHSPEALVMVPAALAAKKVAGAIGSAARRMDYKLAERTLERGVSRGTGTGRVAATTARALTGPVVGATEQRTPVGDLYLAP